MKTYTVNRGDTLYGIAKQFNTTVNSIKSINNLKNNTLSIGQALVIPSSNNSIMYTVKKGDSLYSIAKLYNTTVDSIKSTNKLSSNILQVGQNLIIPVTTQTNYINYIVKKGDNLYSIASKYGVTVNSIKDANNLTSNLLSIGQILKIPSNKIDPITDTITNYETYTVKKGDSLYSIASIYNMTVDEIKKINNLTSNLLSIGQILKVNKDEFTFPTDILECFGDTYLEPIYETYTVKKGDNLYSIARKYNTSVLNIQRLNNLTSNNLSIGQVLKIREVS